MFSPHNMTSSDLKREVDSGVESLLDLYLCLAVAHAVVADVELDIPRISELHVGLKDHHYYRVIKQTSIFSCTMSRVTHINHFEVKFLQYRHNFPWIRL